jgi:predicted  nucleic acid-binding Zn-ribbon protein
VKPNSRDEAPSLTLVLSVRCLECGAVYPKPAGGGTVRQNPGCPECGYVGWVAVNASRRVGSQPRRFVEDRLRRHGG